MDSPVAWLISRLLFPGLVVVGLVSGFLHGQEIKKVSPGGVEWYESKPKTQVDQQPDYQQPTYQSQPIYPEAPCTALSCPALENKRR